MADTLASIRIASPCHENWSDMTGDDQSRHCARCQKHVYDLSAMTEDEAIALLESRGQDRLCLRLHRRADGTVITSDCPVGVRRQRRRAIVRGVAVAAVALAGAACSRSDAAKPKISMGTPAPPPAGQIESHDLIMGEMCLPDDPKTPAPVQPPTPPPAE